MMELARVRKSFQLGPVEVPVLKRVDLTVGAGDLLSIMGPSGSGKSTLMNILGLLGRASAGAYRLDGHDVSTMNDNALSDLRNAKIGFVFQSFNLLPRLSAQENVALPLTYRGWRRASAQARALDILDKVAMAEHAHQRPDQLSGGQKQRVAIARALVGEPAVVLADEPTGALDADTADEVMKLLLRLNARERITVLIITHDQAISRRCRRRVRISDGALVEDGAEHRGPTR